MNDQNVLTQEEIEALRLVLNDTSEGLDIFATVTSEDSIKPLDNLVGEPIEIYVNDTIVAYGEIMLVNDKLGVKLTDLIDKTEWMKHFDE